MTMACSDLVIVNNRGDRYCGVCYRVRFGFCALRLHFLLVCVSIVRALHLKFEKKPYCILYP